MPWLEDLKFPRGYQMGTHILLLTLILSCNFIQTISVFANEIGPNPAIEARADIIEWRYKLENGRVYKRRYNYTKQKWIGDWIPA